MIVLGIDPGKVTGLAVLDTDEARALWCDQTADLVEEVYFAGDIARVEVARAAGPLLPHVVVYERMQSYGRGANSDFIDTAEIGGYVRHALGGVPITRPEVVRTLGLAGKGISKGAVWSEVMRVLGGDDRGGKRCAKRALVSHSGGCPACSGSGWEREPGALAIFRGKGHARDALSLAVAYALREGLL